ncbi:acetoin reductase family protein [Lentinula raphanica]|nr:acetoin reductase family protein [Lentinula raphanica]
MTFQNPRMLNRGVALVTSAAKGAGRAIALRLASEGFKVAVHDLPQNGELLLNVHRHIQRLGQHSVVLAADVTREDEVRSLVADTSRCLGGLDVMVANTAVRETAPLISTTADAWNRLFDVNARGVFFCYKYAAQEMISQGKGGRIIGGSSAWAKRGSPFMSAYSASHFAVRGLTESAGQVLHIEKGAGSENDNEAEDVEDEHDENSSSSGDNPELFALEPSATLDRGSLAHCETPQAIAHLVSYLVSEEAHYITGQHIGIDRHRALPSYYA